MSIVNRLNIERLTVELAEAFRALDRMASTWHPTLALSVERVNAARRELKEAHGGGCTGTPTEQLRAEHEACHALLAKMRQRMKIRESNAISNSSAAEPDGPDLTGLMRAEYEQMVASVDAARDELLSRDGEVPFVLLRDEYSDYVDGPLLHPVRERADDLFSRGGGSPRV